MEWISDPQSWIALLTLTALEIVLGIDNIIFISILSDKLPEHQQALGRRIGLAMAMIMRILLLLSIAWIVRLTTPILSIFTFDLSGKDIILLVGGIFLLAKSTIEIHEKLEGEEEDEGKVVVASLASVVFQIMVLDIVFSLDSVITAVGMADEVIIMILAVIIAVGIMMFSAGPISEFVNHRPTLKILALSFLLLIGFSLVVEGLHFHIPKGYIYFAMGFSVFVEVINLQLRGTKAEPVHLRKQPVIGDKKPASE